MSVGIVGGTGAMGSALAGRFAKAGVPVVLGARNIDKAHTTVSLIAQRWSLDEPAVEAGTIEDAYAADAVILVTPWSATIELCRQYGERAEGKLVLSAVNRLRFDEGQLLPANDGTSAAEAIQQALPRARVVTAFNHLPAFSLWSTDIELSADVLLCGGDEALEEAASIVGRIEGLRPVRVGPLSLASSIEGFTAVLINTNRRNGTHSSLRLVGPE